MEHVLIAVIWVSTGIFACAYNFYDACRMYPGAGDRLKGEWVTVLMIALLYSAFGPIAAMHAITYKVTEKIREGWPR